MVSAYDEHHSSLHLDDENTTTKKRQGQFKATMYAAGGGGGYQDMLTVPPNKSQISMMQSPLATYLQRANLGTSASYHQAISVLSDFKDSSK